MQLVDDLEGKTSKKLRKFADHAQGRHAVIIIVQRECAWPGYDLQHFVSEVSLSPRLHYVLLFDFISVNHVFADSPGSNCRQRQVFKIRLSTVTNGSRDKKGGYNTAH